MSSPRNRSLPRIGSGSFAVGLSVFLCVLLPDVAALAAETASVTLPERVTVASPRVLLGAIARIDARDPNVAKSLDTVLVGLAPLPGRRRILERGEIEQALALAGYAPWDVLIRGADRVEIERSLQRISEAQLARAVRQQLSTELGLPENEIGFRRLEFGRVEDIGGGLVKLQTVFESEPRLGRPIRAMVHVIVGDIPTAQVDGVVEAVHRSQEIAPIQATPSAAARARKNRRLVRSGQPVTLELKGPGLLITAQGKARRTGGLGDEIPVENVISGVVVRGTILGAGRVQVHWSPVTGLPDVREP